ncbi:MAG: hypothetical protein HQL56_11725 [Magnetococcales bacterium]|nr:hypothetical protein [Magnetococcales bacterium]
MIRSGVVLCALLLLSGCAANGVGEKKPPGFELSDLAKTDVNLVVETHQREVLNHLKLLMLKLYRRNPRELAKSGTFNAEERVEKVFSRDLDWRFEELENKLGADCIHLVFEESFKGDRVLAFGVGLVSMTLASYNDKRAFFLLDDLDPQKLHNSARNLELAAWKLGQGKDRHGEPFLLANETEGPVVNLSFERLFGKMIAVQDTMSLIVAQKTKRAIKQAIQFVASAVFLPI